MADFLNPYVRAAFPAVAVATFEEDRFVASLIGNYPGKTVARISSTPGLRIYDRDADSWQDVEGHMADKFPQALAWLVAQKDTFLVLLDWQKIGLPNQPMIRGLLDTFTASKTRGCMALLVGPSWAMPDSLIHQIPVEEFSLPSREELQGALHVVVDSIAQLADSAGKTFTPPDSLEEAALLDASAGLTLQEAEGAFSLAFRGGKFDVGRVAQEKMKIVRQSGTLEVFPPAAPDSVGGLSGLKRYIAEEVLPSLQDPELFIRGLLLLGIPGTGKSLFAKSLGNTLGWPVLRGDIGACMGGIVGESEGKIRHMLATADAVAPCVLWLDEIEKAVGGHQSSSRSDGGTLLRMVGTLLTWMQEHKSRVIVVATCNDYTKLPDELTRAGRFDERFFVDLPTRGEREEIAIIHLRRFAAPETMAAFLAERTSDFTGAEIEDVVKSASRRSKRNVNEASILSAIGDARPLARVAAESIQALRNWAKNTLRPASESCDKTSGPAPSARKIAVDFD